MPLDRFRGQSFTAGAHAVGRRPSYLRGPPKKRVCWRRSSKRIGRERRIVNLFRKGGTMNRIGLVVLAVFAGVLVFGVDARAEMEKSGKYTGKFTFSSTTLRMREAEKDRVFRLAENEGVFLNDAGKGFLHGASTICPVFGVITKAGFTGNGTCVLTDTDGDKAFLDWNCTPRSGGGCEGPFQWTGGTGKYLGLKGSNWFVSYPFIKGTNQGIVDWKGEWQLP